MPLVKAQCTSCGAALEVDESRDAAICPFCNMPYVIEKAINQYKINNTYHIENAVFESNDSEDKVLKRGIAQLEMKDYDDALKTFRKMTSLFPENHKGWLGLILSASELDNGFDESEDLAKYRKNAMYQCPDDEKGKLKNLYVSSENRIALLSEEIRKNEEFIRCNEEDLKKYDGRLEFYYKQDKKASTIKIVSLIAMVISPLIAIACFILFIRTLNMAILPVMGAFVTVAFISFLLFRKYSFEGSNELKEVDTYNLQEEAKRNIETAQAKINKLSAYLDNVKNGGSIGYYLDIMKE